MRLVTRGKNNALAKLPRQLNLLWVEFQRIQSVVVRQATVIDVTIQTSTTYSRGSY